MVGAVVIVIVLLAIPVAVMMTGAVVAGILGFALRQNAEASNEGSELIDLNI